MQAITVEETDEVESMGGVFRVPVLRRGKHTVDLIMTRDTAALLISQLMKRMEVDDDRPCNVIAWKAAT